MRIDVHAHYWPAAYIDAVQAEGRPDLGFMGRQSDDLSPRIEEMDRQGVDVQLFSAVGVNMEIADPARAAAPVRLMNDLFASVAEQYDGRFGAFASLPMPHVDLAIAEAERAIGGLGLQGIALPCIIDGKPIDHPDFDDLWAALDARPGGTVVYVHPAGGDSMGHPGMKDYGMFLLLGSTMQIAMAPLRLAMSRHTTRFPNLRFIFALCGGTLPYLWERYETNLRRGLEMTAVAAVGKGMFSWMEEIPFDREDPMDLFRKHFYFDTSVQDIPEALRLSKRAYGADRILLGSDAIFASLTEAIEHVQSSPDLTDEEKHAILDVNAQSLLHLPERSRAAARA